MSNHGISIAQNERKTGFWENASFAVLMFIVLMPIIGIILFIAYYVLPAMFPSTDLKMWIENIFVSSMVLFGSIFFIGTIVFIIATLIDGTMWTIKNPATALVLLILAVLAFLFLVNGTSNPIPADYADPYECAPRCL